MRDEPHRRTADREYAMDRRPFCRTVDLEVIVQMDVTRSGRFKLRRVLGGVFLLGLFATAAQGATLPNVVVFLADDQGYADSGCYGAKGFTTPNLDRMAAEGMRFTDFCVAASVCSASRAALLTGCYPQRVGIPGVLSANNKTGIHPDEKLLPEILKERGYATAIFGKWHLGTPPKFNPMEHGFDEWLGTVGSNDMGKGRPSLEARRQGKAGVELMDGRRLIEVNPDQSKLTARYTQRAVDFIGRNKDRPFFLYIPYNMPHTPLFASEAFRGRTRRGLYGDVIEEIDSSVGQVLRAIKQHGLDERTLVIYTSDNGPWLIFGDHGGSAGPLRGGKKQLFEGGVRVPCVMRWPQRIPPGAVCRDLVTAMDILPTVALLAGGKLSTLPIDGHDIRPLMWGCDDAKPPTDAFYYYWQSELHAVRSGRWKLQLPHVDSQAPDPNQIGKGGSRGAVMSVRRDLALYDLTADIGERTDLAAKHPQIVKQLLSVAERARDDLGDTITKRPGRGKRQPGTAADK